MRYFSHVSAVIILGILVCLVCGCDSGPFSFDPGLDDTESTLDFSSIKNSGSTIALKRAPSDESKYADIYNLNLFNSDREYVELPEETESVDPTPTPKRTEVDLPHVTLVGTLTTSNNKHVAFIKNSKAEDKTKRNKTIKYEVGDWLGDYMLSKVEASKVTLTRGEELAFLRLRPPKNISNKSRRGRTRNTSKKSPKAGSSKDKRQARTAEDRKKEEREKKAASRSKHSTTSSARGKSDRTSHSSRGETSRTSGRQSRQSSGNNSRQGGRSGSGR